MAPWPIRFECELRAKLAWREVIQLSVNIPGKRKHVATEPVGKKTGQQDTTDDGAENTGSGSESCG